MGAALPIVTIPVEQEEAEQSIPRFPPMCVAEGGEAFHASSLVSPATLPNSRLYRAVDEPSAFTLCVGETHPTTVIVSQQG